MPWPGGSLRPWRCWSRRCSKPPQRKDRTGGRSGSRIRAKPCCWPAARRRHCPLPSRRSSSPGAIRSGGHEAWILRLLGEIAARREPLEVEHALAHYRQALTLAEELGMRPLQAHCHHGLGTLYAASGQREPAHAELSAAIEMYQSMEMTFWLPQAKAALAQVEGW